MKKFALRFLQLFLISIACVIREAHAQVLQSVFENNLTDIESRDLDIFSITQDTSGFLWMGTDEGLIKYNGINYKIYRQENEDEYSLPDNQVYAVLKTANGSIWVGTKKGLCEYDDKHDRFNYFLNDYYVYSIAQDAEGNLWVGTLDKGLAILPSQNQGNSKSASWIFPVHNENNMPSIASNSIYSIAFDVHGNGWIGTDQGLYFITSEDVSSKNFKFQHFTHTMHDISSVSNSSILKIYPDRNGNVWILTYPASVDLLSASDISENKFHFHHVLPAIDKAFQTTLISNNAFFIDCKNECWLGTVDNGLYRFKLNEDLSIQPLAHYINDANDTKSLSDNSVWSFYEDASDILWIGTRKSLSKFIRATDQFNFYPLVTPQFNLTQVVIGSISADEDGTPWMVSESDTVFAYVPALHKIKKFSMIKASGDEIKGLLVVLVSKAGEIFIGTAGSGLFEISKEEKEKFLTALNFTPHAISPPASKIENMSSIQSLAEDQQGNIWAGSGKGLFVYHPQSGAAEPILKTNKQSGLDASNIIRCLTCAPSGKIWIGTDNGLFCYLPSSGKATSYFHLPDDSSSLPDNGITCIHAARDNRIWIGTKKGLCFYDERMAQFKTIKISYEGDFLLINSIEEDSHGSLWVSTNEGLLRILPASNSEIKFNVHDGLLTNRFNANASCATNKLLVFGNERGFISFFPDSIRSNERIPKIKFTDFKLNNQSIFAQRNSTLLIDFLQHEKLTLRYDQNFFSISFAALDFADPSSNQYFYKLEGVDNDWVHAGNQSFASYTNIQPGHYTFIVTASNNHGVRNPKSTSLQIIITPPWYRTWWFYALVALTALSALYLFYRYRINQIKKLFSIRSKIARDLHDDVGSTLSSISLMSQMAKDYSDQQSSEKELFETISFASKEAMELMSDIVWSVNPKNDKVSNILVRMREYAGNMLEAAGIEFQIELADDAKDLVIPMEKRKDFYLIYKEAINNMAKYSKAEKGKITLQKVHGKLVLRIEDNGKGFQVQENRSGNGVVNMQQRANFIGAKLTIDSKPGHGTAIELELPIVST